MTTNSEVVFNLAGVPVTNGGDAASSSFVVVTGSAPELGNWSPSEALQLQDGAQCDAGQWTGKMSLSCCEPTTCVEYKYVLVETGTGNTSWEDGDNRSVDVARGTRVSVSETWGDRESEKTSEDIAASPPPSPAPAAVTCTDTHDGEGQQDVQDSTPAAQEEAEEIVPAPAAEEAAEQENTSAAVPVIEEPVETTIPEADTANTAGTADIADAVDTVTEAGEAIEARGDSADAANESEEAKDVFEGYESGPVNGDAPVQAEECSESSDAARDTAAVAVPPPELDLSQPRPKPRGSLGGGRTGLSATSERALMWDFPVNGVPERHEHNQLFSANQTNYSQMALETLAGGLRPLVVASLSNPKNHLNFVEGPKGSRLRADAFTQTSPDPSTQHPMYLLKYLLKEKTQFLKPPFVAAAHQRLLRAAFGMIAVTNSKSTSSNGTPVVSPRAPLSPIVPSSPAGLGVGPQPGFVSPDEDGTVDVVEDSSILLKHLSDLKQFRNNATVPQSVQESLQYALSNVLNIMTVRDSLDQNSRRLEQLSQEPIEHRRVFAQDLLAQCTAQLDRDDILEAVIDGLAARMVLR